MTIRNAFLAIVLALVLAACGTQRADPIDADDVDLTPAPGADDVTVEVVTATFPVPVDDDALTDDSFILEDEDDDAVDGAVTYDDDERTLAFTPTDPLAGATTYTATIDEDLPFVGTRSLSGPISWEFTTADDPADEEPTNGDDDPTNGDDDPTDGDDDPTDGDDEPTDGDDEPAADEVAFTITDTTHVYDGSAQDVTVTSAPADVTYDVTYTFDGGEVEEPVDAGDYGVLVESTDPDFEGDETATLTIEPRPVALVADDKGKMYGEADPELTFQYAEESLELVGDDDWSGELAREDGEDPDTYEIGQGTLDAGSNYEIAFTEATLTIYDLNLESTTPDHDAEGVSPDTEIAATVNGSLEDFSNTVTVVPCASAADQTAAACTTYSEAAVGGSAIVTSDVDEETGDTLTFTPDEDLDAAIDDGDGESDDFLWYQVTIEFDPAEVDSVTRTWEFRVN